MEFPLLRFMVQISLSSVYCCFLILVVASDKQLVVSVNILKKQSHHNNLCLDNLSHIFRTS